MIKTIELSNFMAYEHEVVSFGDNNLIEIVGKNGSGKSALLEAIVYALYGVSRLAIGELARKNGDGSHEVKVQFTNIHVQGDSLFVTRGRKASGSGYAKLAYNSEDNIIAEGVTEVDKEISERIKMDSAMFLSSYFFGLSDEKKGDKLINVTPATRLENHQALAGGISKYKGWYKKVGLAIKPLESKSDTLKGNIEAYNNSLAEISVKELTDKIAMKNIEQKEVQDKINALKIVELRAKLARFRAIKITIDNLKQNIVKYDNIIKSAEVSLQEDKDELKDIIDEIKGKVEEIERYKSELKKYDIDVLNADKDIYMQTIASLNSSLLLHNTAIVNQEGKCNCPLCASGVNKEIVIKWKFEIDNIKVNIENNERDMKAVLKKIKEYKELKNKYDAVISSKSNKEATKKTLESMIKNAELSIKNTKSKRGDEIITLESQEAKFNKKQYDKIYADISKEEQKNADLLDKKTEISNEISVMTEKINSVGKIKDKLNKVKKELKEVIGSIGRHKVLLGAFAKQGIPMRLLKKFNTILQQRATNVYNHFRNGQILIEEVPGSQPGLVYYLSDVSGKRLVASLSKGEKMLIFIAFRVALSQLLNASIGVSIDFLVLDEIAANLDVENRDALVSLVNGVLRQFYKQIIVVQHSSMKNIFELSLLVEKEGTEDNGISRVSVA